MKKRIAYNYGVLYEGWVGQIKRWYGWSTIYEFDCKEDAYRWYYNKK